MKKNVTDYQDYRTFILDMLAANSESNKGIRSRLAIALDCQAPFVSQVLNGEKDFSHEQILKLSDYFELSASEKTFLIELLSFNRASSPALKEYYLSRLEQLKQAYHQRIYTKNPQHDQILSLQDQVTYYSHWLYSAVHMGCTIPELQSINALVKYFHISAVEIMPVIDFLVSKELIAREQNDKCIATKKKIYVDGREPVGKSHHSIWRNKIIADMNSYKKTDLHFTLCFTATIEDIDVIRSKIETLIVESTQLIRASPEKELAILCIDLQKV